MNLDRTQLFRRPLTFLCIFILLGACSGGPASSKLPESIKAARATYDADPSDSNRNALVASIYREAKKDGPSQQTILETGVQYGKELQDPILTSSSLHSLIRVDRDSPETPNRILELIEIMDKDLKQVNAVIALKRGFYGEYPEHPNAIKYKETLPVYTQNIDTLLNAAARRITADSTGNFNLSLAREYVNISEGLVLAHPSNPNATDILFNGAKMAGTIRDFKKSMSLYDWVINEYPQDTVKRGQSIFMKAFTYDTGLKNIEKARENYQLFIDEYPEHDLADDAKFLVDNLGLSDQEFLKKIQSSGKKESK